jgi:hypothetical protein
MIVNVELLEFNPVRGGEIRKGYCINDGKNKIVYDDTWDSIPEEDLDVLKKIVSEQYKQNEDITTMLDSVLYEKEGMEIGNNWYEFEEVESIIKNSWVS